MRNNKQFCIRISEHNLEAIRRKAAQAHMTQSFPRGADVDPHTAHEAARQLAGYFAGCEVLVCTHTDREHIHSHCIINSVNFETGKKLHNRTAASAATASCT